MDSSFSSLSWASQWQAFGQRRRYWIGVLVLVGIFSWPLWRWMQLAWANDLQSYVILIPAISMYLIWLRREEVPTPVEPRVNKSMVWILLGCLSCVVYGWTLSRGGARASIDALTWSTAGFVCLCIGWTHRVWDRHLLQAVSFPLHFLLFMIPLPPPVLSGLETVLQHASAEVASWWFSATGLPFLRHGLVFQLPGMVLEVAQECSGVRSTLVLFITSWVGGFLFLRHVSNRVALALFTLVLGILRNGFRIWVIASLCVYVSPDMIHSPIHKQGGPLFFLVSLIPLALVIVGLLRRERPKKSLERDGETAADPVRSTGSEA